MKKTAQLFSLMLLFVASSLFAQPVWSRLNGPAVDVINDVFKDPVTGTWYAASGSPGIYRSESKGATWTQVTYDTSEYPATVAGYFLRKGGVLWAFPRFGSGGGTWYSVDNGANWKFVGINASWPVVVNDTIYVGEHNSGYFYRVASPQNVQWVTNSNLNTLGNGVFKALGGHKGVLAASLFNSGLAYSENGGRTWAAATYQMNLSGFTASSFYATDSALYVNISNGNTGLFLKSKDGGKNWNLQGTGHGTAYLYDGVVSGRGNFLFVSNPAGFYRSSDDGVTWEKIAGAPGSANSIYANEGSIYVSTGGGIYRSDDDGLTFSKWNNGLSGGVYMSLERQNGTWFLGSQTGEIFESKDNFASWKSIFVSPSSVTPAKKMIAYKNKQYAFVGSESFIRDTASTTWAKTLPAGANPAFSVLNRMGNAVVFNDTLWTHWAIFLGNTGLFYSTESQEYIFKASNLPGNVLRFETVDTTLFALVENNGIWKRTTKSPVWQKMSNLRESMNWIGGKLYSMNIGDDSLYVSTDLGATWKGAIDLPILYSGIHDVWESKGLWVLSGGRQVAFVSTDSLKTWTPLGFVPEILDNNGFILGTFDGDMYVGGGKAGFFVNKSTPTSNERSDKNPASNGFALLTSYPNPFNPSATIRVDLATASNIDVSIYDLTGRKVATLATGNKPAGTHEFRWNAASSASGLYFVRLTAGNAVLTRKMTLSK